MRVVAALGGNALLERGEKPDADIQESHIQQAVQALAPLARAHDLVVTHGNGPQVGMLALESARDPALTRPYSFDVLGAQTQGMIGYWLAQALGGAVPGLPAGCLVSQAKVDPDDPAFANPTKFVGPVYQEKEALDLAAERGWVVRRDGAAWRRVVPSPEPLELVELPLIRVLLGSGALVVCAGGGGIPVAADASGVLRGVEAVVDKDLTAALLACALDAGALLLLTDVDAVIDGFGTPDARPIRHATPSQLRARSFPAGRWARKWRPPAGSWRRPAGWRRSAASTPPWRCSLARPAPSSPRKPRAPVRLMARLKDSVRRSPHYLDGLTITTGSSRHTAPTSIRLPGRIHCELSLAKRRSAMVVRYRMTGPYRMLILSGTRRSHVVLARTG